MKRVKYEAVISGEIIVADDEVNDLDSIDIQNQLETSLWDSNCIVKVKKTKALCEYKEEPVIQDDIDFWAEMILRSQEHRMPMLSCKAVSELLALSKTEKIIAAALEGNY